MVLRALFLGEPVSLVDFDADEVTVLRRDHEKALRRREHLLTCPNCGGTLHPVRYRWGLDVFGHDPGQGARCAAWRGESARHDNLKRLIAGAAGRVAGWQADVEVAGEGIDPDTGRPPVVDVVATREAAGPFERPRGWEAQLSPASDAQILNRQQVRDAFLTRCDWISADRPAWRHQVPWLRVGDEPGPVTVVEGIVAAAATPAGADYLPGDPEPLSRVVADTLRPGPRQLEWVEGLYRPTANGDTVGAFIRLGAGPLTAPARTKPIRVQPFSNPTLDCERPRLELAGDERRMSLSQPFDPDPPARPARNRAGGLFTLASGWCDCGHHRARHLHGRDRCRACDCQQWHRPDPQPKEDTRP